MKPIPLRASSGIDRKDAKMDAGAFRAELEQDTAASERVANDLGSGESRHSPCIRPDSSFCSFQSV